MKHTFLLLATISIFVISCKKSKIDEAPPVTITKADFGLNFKPGGQSFSNADINITASPVTIPTSGENQSWDVSGLTISSTNVIAGFITPANAAFVTATYGFNYTNKFGFGALQSAGTPATDYFEVSDNGFFYLGMSTAATDVLTIASIGGTLTYAPQNIVASTRAPQINLPASFNSNNSTTNIVSNTNFIANAPAVGVNNTPGQVRFTDSINNNIFASGTLTLKNIGKVRVLVNKRSFVQKTNYFLGGAPAPTALLNLLGLTDGAITTTVSYDYYAPGLGRVGRIFCNATGTTVVSASFRVQ